MESRKDIQTLEDIRLLVDRFYTRIREDDLLKDIFNNIIQDKWPQHLEKMYRFWQTVLLNEMTYSGTPFPPHAHMHVTQTHFSRWTDLFQATVDSLFCGEKAERAKWQGNRMAQMFLLKINYLNTNRNEKSQKI